MDLDGRPLSDMTCPFMPGSVDIGSLLDASLAAQVAQVSHWLPSPASTSPPLPGIAERPAATPTGDAHSLDKRSHTGRLVEREPVRVSTPFCSQVMRVLQSGA